MDGIVPERPVDAVPDTGNQEMDLDDSHEQESFHHQIYTREENSELQDDGVTIEEVPEHDEKLVETRQGEDWFEDMVKNLEPALETLNQSILRPMFEMVNFPLMHVKIVVVPCCSQC